MPTGEGLLALARGHIGEKYDFVTVPKNNPNWKGPWDCAEFASWLVYQEAHILYGCTDDHAPAAVAEAYTGGWKIDSLQIGRRIPTEDAAKTVGAFLLRYPPTAGSMGHIAVSDGHAAAQSRQRDVPSASSPTRFTDGNGIRASSCPASSTTGRLA